MTSIDVEDGLQSLETAIYRASDGFVKGFESTVTEDNETAAISFFVTMDHATSKIVRRLRRNKQVKVSVDLSSYPDFIQVKTPTDQLYDLTAVLV